MLGKILKLRVLTLNFVYDEVCLFGFHTHKSACELSLWLLSYCSSKIARPFHGKRVTLNGHYELACGFFLTSHFFLSRESMAQTPAVVALVLVFAASPTSSFWQSPIRQPEHGLRSAPISPAARGRPELWHWQPAGTRTGAVASLRCTPQKGQGHGEPSVFEPLGNVAAGCVLVASPDEIDHFSRHAVVLVLSHGAQGSRGVTLEMATAFNVGEMAASLADSPFAGLPLFRGGSAGKDQILMLHDVEGLRGSQPIGSVICDACSADLCHFAPILRQSVLSCVVCCVSSRMRAHR